MLNGCKTLLECEDLVVEELSRVTLLGQIPFERNDVDKLGHLLADLQWKESQVINHLRSRTPVSFMCFLVWTGILGYRDGDFWSAVRKYLGEIDAGLQQQLGQLFLELAEKYDIFAFDVDGALRFVTPILGQGMIPDSCLPEFFSKVLMPLIQRDLVRPTDPKEIVSELRTRRLWHGQNAAVDQKMQDLTAQTLRIKRQLRWNRKRQEIIAALGQLRELGFLAGDPEELAGLPEDYHAYQDSVATTVRGLESKVSALRKIATDLTEAKGSLTDQDRLVLSHASEVTAVLADAPALARDGTLSQSLLLQLAALGECMQDQARDLLTEPWNEQFGPIVLGLPHSDLEDDHKTLLSLYTQLGDYERRHALPSKALQGATRARVHQTRGNLVLAISGAILIATLSPVPAVAGAMLIVFSGWRHWRHGHKQHKVLQEITQVRNSNDVAERARDAYLERLTARLQRLPVSPPCLLAPDFVERLKGLHQTYTEVVSVQHRHHEVEKRLRAKVKAVTDLAIASGVALRSTPQETLSAFEQAITEAKKRESISKEAEQNLRERILPQIAAIEESQKSLLAEKAEVESRLTTLGNGDLEEGVRRHAARSEALKKLQALCSNLKLRSTNLELPQPEAVLGLNNGEEILHNSLVEEEQHLQEELNDMNEKLDTERRSLERHPAVFSGVDEPIRRFLLFGGTAAEDFLVSAVQYAYTIMTGGARVASTSPVLPQRVKEALEMWLDSPPLSTRSGDWRNELWDGFPGFRTNERSDRMALSGPTLRFNATAEEISVYLPARVLPIDQGSTSDDCLLFEITEVGSREEAKSWPMPLYRSGKNGMESGLFEVPLPGPAPGYGFRLQLGSCTLGQWSQTGLLSECPFLAFSDTGLWVGSGDLSRRPHWIVMRNDCRIDPKGVRESGKLYGAWNDYGYYLVDLGEGSDPKITQADGSKITIPLRHDSISDLRLAGSNPLWGVTCEDADLYQGYPPRLLFSTSVGLHLESWTIDLFPEPGSFPDTFRRYHLADLPETSLSHDSFGLSISLDDDRLLGSNAAGRFLLRIRSQQGHDSRLKLCIVPGLTVSRSERLLFPRRKGDTDTKPIRITLKAQSNIKFEPLSPVEDLLENPREITFAIGMPQEVVRGNLAYPLKSGAIAFLPLEIKIPKLQWRLVGVRNTEYGLWQDQIEELPISDLESPGSPRLMVRVPSLVQGSLRLVLHGSDHQVTSPLRNGESRFDLSRFADTLRTGPPVSTFLIASDNDSIAFLREGVPLFHVRTRWEVKNLTCEDRSQGDRYILDVSWTELGESGNRVIRFWQLPSSTAPSAEEFVPEGVYQVSIIKPIDDLPPGDYLLEIADHDPWRSNEPTFPQPNAPNTLLLRFKSGDRTPTTLSSVTDLTIAAVEDPTTGKHYPLNGKYTVSPYTDRTHPEPGVYVGRVAIRLEARGRARVSWENSVTYGYDPGPNYITFLEDKDGDGAYFCRTCRRLFWSRGEEMLEILNGHKQSLCLPYRFIVRSSAN